MVNNVVATDHDKVANKHVKEIYSKEKILDRVHTCKIERSRIFRSYIRRFIVEKYV